MQAIKFFKPLAALALCTLALSAAAPSLAQEASLKIDDPWVRATVPSQHATGVFMRLTSATPARGGGGVPGGQACRSPRNGYAGQRDEDAPVSGIDLPAGQAVELKPGGYHIMLLDLPGQIKEGDHVALTLVVEDDKHQQRRVPVNAIARPLGAAATGHGAGGHGAAPVGDRPRRCRSPLKAARQFCCILETLV